MAKVYFKGFKDATPLNTLLADSEAETTLFENSKNIKLKFTRKQFASFLTACDIFKTLSEHQNFNDYVNEVLGGNVEINSVTKQLVDPILKATEKIQNPEIKSLLRDQQPIKATSKSYFTEPIQMTSACRQLYNAVTNNISFNLRYSIDDDIVCITDIRKMLTAYFVQNKLKKPEGTVFDEFLQTIAPKMSATLDTSVESSEKIIPKGDIKTVHAIIKEIAFE
jgi:hypothetical protein